MSFAVIKTGGKQYLVKAGDKLLVEKLPGEAGVELSFDQVLMVWDSTNEESNLTSEIATAELSQTSGKKTDLGTTPKAEGDKAKCNFGTGTIGTPLVIGATVTAKIVAQGRAVKKTVFKYKNKTRYKKKKGHRQPYTQIEITAITA